MMQKSTTKSCYDQKVLVRFLESEVSPSEEESISTHIAQCDGCRQSLREITGGENVWNEVSDSLDPASARLAADWDLHDTCDLGSVAKRDLKHIKELLAPTDDPTKLGRLGQYEICGVIGRGSAGVVVKALDTRLNRFVAIKLLAPAYSNLGSSRRRFEREGRAIASVKDPHVVPIYNVDEFNGTPYIVMQYIPDGSLQQRIDKNGPMSTRDVACLALQVTTGLSAAHKRGIVHRDVKPANVLLENGIDGAMVTDFGLARVVDEATMTHSGSISGTPQYMSPEQAKGERVDPRSDLFSLGSLMYAAATGHAPFRSESVFGIIKKVCDEQPKSILELNADIEPWMVGLIEKLHSKEPGERFESAEDVKKILSEELAHLQNPAMVPKPARQWWQNKTKPNPNGKRFLNLSIAASLILLGAFGFYGINQFVGNGSFFGPSTSNSPSLGFTIPGFGMFAGQDYVDFSKTTEKEIAVKNGGMLFLRTNIGLVDVKTHDKSTVEFKLVQAIQADDESAADEWFKETAIDYSFEGDHIDSDVRLKKGKDAAIVIDIPQVNYSESQASVKKVKSTKIELLLPKEFNLNLGTIAGSISAQDIDGWAKARTVSGSITVGDVSGQSTLETSAGSIRVGDVGALCKLMTKSGTIFVENVTGDLNAASNSGNVQSGDVTGNVNVASVSGSINLGYVKGSVKAISNAGSINILLVDGHVEAESKAGAIEVNVTDHPKSPCSVTTSAGSVKIGYVNGSNLSIDAQSSAGRIKAPFLEKAQKNARYEMNEGSVPFTVRTSAGSILFKEINPDNLKIGNSYQPMRFDGRNEFNIAYELHMAGKLEEAIPAHKLAAEFKGFRGIATYNLGCAYALQGKKKLAIQTIGKAVDFGFVDLPQFEDDSDLDSLRGDAAFKSIIERIKKETETHRPPVDSKDF